MEYKVGDMVYYNRIEQGGKYGDTIPCEVVKVNKRTLFLSDGETTYRNVRLSSVYLQNVDL